MPPGVLDMMRLPGMGPKKAAVLFKELNITSLTELKEAAQAGEIQKLKGFAKKTEDSILANVDQAAQAKERSFYAHAEPLVDEIVDSLSSLNSVHQVSPAGSFRRRKETVGDLDVLATSDDHDEVMDALANHELVEEVLQRGDTKQRVRLIKGLEMDLRVVPAESYGAAMQYFTGSKEHNIELRKRAQKRDLDLNEYGLFSGENSVAGKNEEEIYEALDLIWIPPELREDRGEFELAEKGELPELVEPEEIVGDLHMHTTATDGTASIEEMIAAAKNEGGNTSPSPIIPSVSRWPTVSTQNVCESIGTTSARLQRRRKEFTSCAASNATFWKTRHSTCRMTCWRRRRLGDRGVCITV